MHQPLALLEYAIVAAVALGVYMFARKYGGGAALEQLERANNVLERRVAVLEDENARKDRRIAELEGKTDLTIALVPVLEQLKLHEAQATRRSDATLNVLHLIAGKLGAETA